MTVDKEIELVLRCLPHEPGVYRYYDKEGTIIYVGKAKDLHRRVNSYFNKEHESRKTRNLVANIARIEYQVVDSEQDAFLLENNLIKEFQPHYNILLKDGKSYPSICITREDFPRIFKTRRIIRGAGQYYGPYSYGNTVDLVLELIHKLYPIRTCNTPMTRAQAQGGKYKVCLKYHLGNCCGICELKKQSDAYQEWIEAARQIIRGDGEEIQHLLKQQMMTYAEKMEYEKAAELKEKYDLLEQFCSKTVITNSSAGDVDVFGYDEQNDNVYISILHVHKGSIVQGQTIEYKRSLEESKEEMLAHGIVELREQIKSTTPEMIVPFIPELTNEKWHIHLSLGGDKKKLQQLAQKNVEQYKIDRLKQSDRLNPDQRATRILTELQSLLHLSKIPFRIESFDNSNIMGTDAVSGCVVFKKGKPAKSEYKKFSIKTVVGADDYASMREVVYRRYKRQMEEGGEMPDLILADGGIGQMHAIEEVIRNMLELDIPVAGLKKDDKHRTQTIVYGEHEFTLPINSELFHLLTRIQDEVHRWAITYHKNVRSKRQIHSQLDDIQGVGEETKRKILLHFGSLNRARSADETEWKKLLGTKRGSTIYNQIQAKISR